MLGLVVGVGYESGEWLAMHDTMGRCSFGRKEHSNLVYGIPSYPTLRFIQTDEQLFSSLLTPTIVKYLSQVDILTTFNKKVEKDLCMMASLRG